MAAVGGVVEEEEQQKKERRQGQTKERRQGQHLKRTFEERDSHWQVDHSLHWDRTERYWTRARERGQRHRGWEKSGKMRDKRGGDCLEKFWVRNIGKLVSTVHREDLREVWSAQS
jgi:hypothetical protein